MRQADQKPASRTLINNIENITFGVELETTIPATAQVGVGQYHNGTNANTARVGSELKHFPKFGHLVCATHGVVLLIPKEASS